jgi:hypothetical protein
MVLWNLSDGGLSRSGPLLWPFESMQVGTLGTIPHQLDTPVLESRTSRI